MSLASWPKVSSLISLHTRPRISLGVPRLKTSTRLLPLALRHLERDWKFNPVPPETRKPERNAARARGTRMGWQRDEEMVRAKKRLIVCCDGTWMNSDYGFVKPGLLSGKGGLQVPSNVTRISRCFKRKCSDGTLQIINYESGVGSGSGVLDNVTGGAFGSGLAEVSDDAVCPSTRGKPTHLDG